MRLIKIAFATLAATLLINLPAKAAVINLGNAGDYTLLATGSPAYGGSMVLGSAVDIGGNIGARDSVLIGTGSIIHGNVDGGSISYDPSTTVNGVETTQDTLFWSGLSQDLKNASLQAASLSGSNRGYVNTTTTLSGSGVSVFNLDGLNLAAGATLFLDGTAGSEFIINVSSAFIMNSGAQIVALGGLDPAAITFNILNQSIIQMNNATAIGTFIASESFIQLGDGNILNASRFLGGTLQGNLQTVRPPVVTDVPAPVGMSLMMLGLAFFAIGIVRKRP